MAIIKCKMCGGDLDWVEGASTAECKYCCSVQTIPKVDDEKKLTLFARANRLRAACEFDKAAGVYEAIVADFQEEAEAYWGLVLCKYGIEYVDDPATGKKVPTCHRSSFDSLMEDSDYEQALENADMWARKVYREEAKQIEEIRKGIIAVSANEEPYDIFICYKETAEDGERTLDSVLAQDVYDALTDKGYRVFFSRITLEDKLGVEYEPYIFGALNSAKIMLAFGTDYEYFNAVWVKNEWSRFLKLMAKDKEKHLIPCYKGIDAYDMPKEFAKLQAQDLGKVGAMQDLLRGIDKILPRHTETVQETVVVQQNNNAVPLMKRGYISLEDGDWKKADQLFEEVLNLNPECAMAYIGKLLAAEKAVNLDTLAKRHIDETEEATVEFFSVETSGADEDLEELERQRLAAEEEAAEKYAVPEYLSPFKIRTMFKAKELKYSSETACRKEQYAKEEALWKNGREINRALKYATPQEKKQIEDAVTSAMSAVQQRLAKAISEDEENIKNIAKAYREQIEEAQALAKQEHAIALEKWEKECEQQYEKACHLMRTSITQDGFRQAKTLFAKIHNYRDSMEKAKECRALEEKFVEEKKRRELLTKEMASLMTERNQLGIFEVKRRNEIDARLAEIQKEFG